MLKIAYYAFLINCHNGWTNNTKLSDTGLKCSAIDITHNRSAATIHSNCSIDFFQRFFRPVMWKPCLYGRTVTIQMARVKFLGREKCFWGISIICRLGAFISFVNFVVICGCVCVCDHITRDTRFSVCVVYLFIM